MQYNNSVASLCISSETVKSVNPTDSGSGGLSGPAKAMRTVCLVASFAFLPAFLLILDSHDSITDWMVRSYERLTLPLHTAALEGNSTELSQLLSEGEDFESRNRAGETPLHVAVKAGNPDAVYVLLEAGADHSARNRRDRTPLLYAARFGNAEISKKLITAGAEVNLSVDDGPTPLYQAASYGNHEIVTILLDAGAEIDRKSPHWFVGQSTPLVVAAIYGNLSAVSVLITAGADINGDTSDEWSSPIYYAARFENEEIVRYILTVGVELDPNSVSETFSSAVSRGLNDLLLVLLKAGADVNFDGGPPYHLPPLFWAIFSVNHEGVSLLLDANVDPNQIFDLSVSPIAYDMMVTRNLTDVAHKIKELSDVDVVSHQHSLIEDRDRISPIVAAVIDSDYVTASLLLNAGADINVRQFNGMSLLHFAIDRYNDIDLVQWLLAHGADPDIRDVSGASPLHYASFMGYDDSVKMLIEAGAEVNATNLVGMTPTDYAGCLEHDDTQELLSRNGATTQDVEPDPKIVAEACGKLIGGYEPWELRLIARISPMLVGIATWDDRIPLPITTPAKVGRDVIRMLCCFEV